MNIKVIFSILSFCGFVLLTSCGGDGSKSQTAAADSANAKSPEALQKLNAQINQNPNDADLYHQRAKYYFFDKNFTAGLDDMNKVMSLDSSKAVYFLTLSDLYFVTNQTAKSKRALEKCIQLDNQNVEAILKLAELYLYVTKYDKSIEYINMALKINEHNAKAYFMKGMNYKELKDTMRAISSMQTAVEQDQQYYNAYIQLGLLHAAKRNVLAVDYYKNALRIQPASTEAWYDLAKFYQDVQEWKQAIEGYNKLLKIDPNYKNAHYNLGVIYLVGLKEYQLALNHFSDAIKIDTHYTEAYYGQGLCYQAMGDKKNAMLAFQTCLSINPQFELASIALKKL
jgi:tetratricopeptide (TPR) repeat protein